MQRRIGYDVWSTVFPFSSIFLSVTKLDKVYFSIYKKITFQPNRSRPVSRWFCIVKDALPTWWQALCRVVQRASFWMNQD